MFCFLLWFWRTFPVFCHGHYIVGARGVLLAMWTGACMCVYKYETQGNRIRKEPKHSMDTESRPAETTETTPNTVQKDQTALTFGASTTSRPDIVDLTASRRGAERGHACHHNACTPCRARPRATTAPNSTEGGAQGTMRPVQPGLFANNTTLKSDEYVHLCAEINKLKKDLAYMKKTIYTTYTAAGNTQAPIPTLTPTPTPTPATSTTTMSQPTKAHHSKHAVSFAHSEAPGTALGKQLVEIWQSSRPHQIWKNSPTSSKLKRLKFPRCNSPLKFDLLQHNKKKH